MTAWVLPVDSRYELHQDLGSTDKNCA